MNKVKAIVSSFAEAMLGAVMIVGTVIMMMFATGIATIGPVFADIDKDFSIRKAELERTFADRPSNNPMAVYVPGKSANQIVLMLVDNPTSTTTNANTGIWTVTDSYYVYAVSYTHLTLPTIYSV